MMLNGVCDQYIKDCDNVQDGEEDDDDWAEETTEEAQRRRMDEISEHAKNLTLSEDLEKTLEDRVNLFYSFVKVNTCVDFQLKQFLYACECLKS